MTTTITVKSHNYPALVQVYDTTHCPPEQATLVSEHLIEATDGEVHFYCTTMRELRITDVEFDHPMVPRRDPPADEGDVD
jgi:hypothetical protein